MLTLDRLSEAKVMILSANAHTGDSLERKIYRFNKNIQVTHTGYTSAIVTKLDTEQYDILILELNELEKSCSRLIRRCKKKYPQLQLIAFCDNCEISLLKKFLHAGIRVYISKNIEQYEIGIALAKAISGEKYVSIEISGKLASIAFPPKKK